MHPGLSCKGNKMVLKIVSMFILISILFCGIALAQDKEAVYYEKLDQNKIKCVLCPRMCVINPGKRGYCGVRKNIEGKLYTLVYGKPCAVHVDPIEKKPLFHFYPGSKAFSIATAGCNLACIFCQNWEISQAYPEEVVAYELSPAEVVDGAITSKCKSVSYTYTEPTIFYEYMLDTAKAARLRGVKNNMHSCGYINEKPLRELCQYLDAANVDLKGFTDEFYWRIGKGYLQPVLDSIRILKEEGVWIEITNLIIPTLNDDPQKIREMCQWIKGTVGPDVPIHFSRFYPSHKMRNLPATPVETLEDAKEIAEGVGLRFVYIGNVPGHPGENTYCPRCKKVLIKRVGYHILQNNIVDGKCKFCGEKIPGVWE